MREIVPSILSADFGNLLDEIRKVEEGGAKRLHFDVMDGHFVPNLSFGAPILASIRDKTDLHVEAHLMVSNPEERIDEFIKAGADTVIVHEEVEENLGVLLAMISEGGAVPGACINPATPADLLFDYLDEIKHLLIMTVNPGFGGQELIGTALEKIEFIRSQYGGEAPLFEVDGGINPETVAMAAEAGADLIVSGSSIFHSDDARQRFIELNDLANGI